MPYICGGIFMINMRKREKEELLNAMKTVYSEMEAVKTYIQKQQEENILALLAECQQAVITVGNTLEQAKEGMSAIHSLENVCEMIYECSVPADTEKRLQICEQAQDLLQQIESSMETNIQEKKLVVFLPYKAAMWDSLESVWKASAGDGEWETIVMPIPYFSKKSDGTLGKMEYEGDIFPEYVPITHWQHFSLEEEHPDMIFIHNPYDQYNFVTSVHPMFYSSKIRKYTDKLVYIPYFIHQRDVVSDDYCVLPGTIYADTVVLQSEKVREQYIRYFTEEFPELAKRLGREKLEAKFQALGSPKFDACCTEKDDIPKEWQQLMGNDSKKIIFFNTHLNGLMAGNSEKFLKKLKWVFDIFEEREDALLLWRPHPLMLQTAESMNPAAVEPYLKLAEYYKKQGFGIYDDSENLHRAVNVADAYYGDASSVTELFRNQGKPVMIMDYEVLD